MDSYISNPNYQPKAGQVKHMSGSREVLNTIVKIILYSLPVILFLFPFMVLILRSFFSYEESVGYFDLLYVWLWNLV